MMTQCITCGQFVQAAPRYENMAGDRLCPRCYDPDLDVDVLTLPTEPDTIPGYDYPQHRKDREIGWRSSSSAT